jgi:hypothetical protein
MRTHQRQDGVRVEDANDVPLELCVVVGGLNEECPATQCVTCLVDTSHWDMSWALMRTAENNLSAGGLESPKRSQ